MMEMLLTSWRSFMKYSVVFLFSLMRVKLWESGLQVYMKQKELKAYA